MFVSFEEVRFYMGPHADGVINAIRDGELVRVDYDPQDNMEVYTMDEQEYDLYMQNGGQWGYSRPTVKDDGFLI